MSEFEPRRKDYQKAVQEFFEMVPFHQTIGASLDRVSPGYAEVSLTITKGLTQQLGVLHAGVLLGLADNAMGAAAASLISSDKSLLSTNFALALMRPGSGERVRAEGRVVKAGRRLLYCEAHLYNDANELITHVTGTLAIVSAIAK